MSIKSLTNPIESFDTSDTWCQSLKSHTPYRGETETTAHNLVPVWFTPEQWSGSLASPIDDLVAKPGGVLLVSVEVEPRRRNYPKVGFGVFDADERKALRRALEVCRRNA
jgi:hypothetical protein